MEHILSLSYGKDSLACLGAIEQLGLPLDRIIHAEVWATDTIPADLPPMVEFKKKADAIIEKRWGIKVEHISTKTYEHFFYKTIGDRAIKMRDTRIKKFEDAGKKHNYDVFIYGFPCVKGAWCNSKLKVAALKSAQPKGSISYIGIAADEPNRIHRLSETKRSPLVEAGWTEEMCRQWCVENDLLSPIYTTATRGGVGSATIKAFSNCDCCGKNTPNIGGCFSNGIRTALFHSIRMGTRCMTLTGVFSWRMMVLSRLMQDSSGRGSTIRRERK